jgi:hypothetical protein
MDGRKFWVWFPARAEILFLFYNTATDTWTQPNPSSADIMGFFLASDSNGTWNWLHNNQKYNMSYSDSKFCIYHTIRNTFQATWRNIQGAYKLSEDFVTFVSITHSERKIWSSTMYTSHHVLRHYQNCESSSTPQSGTSHMTCLRGFSGNGSIAWTSAVSHVGRTSNAFKVTMKLQTFLFQMVVT